MKFKERKEKKMTRRKDTIRSRNEITRIAKQKRNSRLEKRKQENEENKKGILQEKQLLCQVANLPNELIRLVYDFMSGNAKMILFPKYKTLNRHFCPFEFELQIEQLFRKMSNTQILDLIYTGTLLKYPEIVGALSDSYYYSIIDHDFHTVTGYNLLNLWATERLSYDFVRGNYSMDETVKLEIDNKMRERIAAEVKNYICDILHHFLITHHNLCKKYTSSLNHDNNETYRDLFLRMEKAMYLYRVVMQYIEVPRPDIVEDIDIDIVDNLDPFSNELLIPTPIGYPISI